MLLLLRQGAGGRQHSVPVHGGVGSSPPFLLGHTEGLEVSDLRLKPLLGPPRIKSPVASSPWRT